MDYQNLFNSFEINGIDKCTSMFDNGRCFDDLY